MIGAVAVWMLTAVFAVIATGALVIYRAEAGEAALLPMIGYAAALPIASLLSRDWWAFAAQMSIAFVLSYISVIVGLEVVGAADTMGPAGMAYLFPFLVFSFGSTVAACIRLAAMGLRQLNGRRGDQPFVSRGAYRNMSIVALAAVAPFALAAVISAIGEIIGAITGSSPGGQS